MRTPNDVTQNLNSFVIGPNYKLVRYAAADERPDCAHGEFSEGTDLPLGWVPFANTDVDTTWFGVTVADAYVRLGESSTAECLDASGDGAGGFGTRFEFSFEDDKSLVGTRPSKLAFGTPVKPGDYLAYDGDDGVQYTKILSISGGTRRDGEISYKVRTASGAAADGAFTVDLSGYTGEKSGAVTITFTGTGTQADPFKATWRSTIGIKETTPQAVPADAALAIGDGITITKDSGFAAGTYVLTITLTEAYVSDTVKVADLVPSDAKFTFVRKVDVVDIDKAHLSADGDGVTLAGTATVDLGADKPYALFAGTAYLNQRNLRKDHTDAVYSISDDYALALELGAYDTPDNPLAYAIHIMRLNSANAVIKYIGVPSNDAAGFATALKRASLTSDVYAFCPLTEDHDIIESVVADCERLSKPEEKSWRIAFFSEPTPGTRDVTPMVDGVHESCRVTGTLLTCYSGNAVSTTSRLTETVQVGDEVTVIIGSGVAVTTTVARVKSNTQLELTEAIENANSTSRPLTIIHRLSPMEYVEAIAATSASFRNRRAYNVFPNSLRASDGHYVPGMYAAAAVCALACSVQPQQPITNVEVRGFVDLPDVYSNFSRDELNQIAAGGTLILMQDKIGGTVYVRHQISTAYSDGDLNATELSLVKNLDSISYYFANRFAPYTGRYNVSDDLLTELRGILEDGLSHLETTTETNKLIGPQVIAEGTEVRSLYRDPDEKDKVYADVALNLPEPFNNFDLHLQVI